MLEKESRIFGRPPKKTYQVLIATDSVDEVLEHLLRTKGVELLELDQVKETTTQEKEK